MLKLLLGDPNTRKLKRYQPLVEEINLLEDEVSKLTDDDLRNCLSKSDVIISLWIDKKIVGFGRALSDGIFRSVLWDIVIDQNYQGKGYGKVIVNALLESKTIKKSKKIYLMTTNKKDFYAQLNFEEVNSQKLLIKVSKF